jgi:PmbA protein
MTRSPIAQALASRAGDNWEIYEKHGASREVAARAAAGERIDREEEGWAARWWEDGARRFAAASDSDGLLAAIAEASAIETVPEDPPEWPSGSIGETTQGPAGTVPDPPELFAEVARLLAAESRGEAALQQLTLRSGVAFERITNGKGLEAALTSRRLDGIATAVGRRGTRACEARVAFRWNEGPDPASLARRLADRSTLPLSDRTAPFDRGELLLDPSVSAALLAALAPLWIADPAPRWISKSQFAAPCVGIVDDATADAPCDGEGTRSRRVELVREGVFRTMLSDLTTARRRGSGSTGHGVRPSYRTVPAPRPRRLFFETPAPVSPRELLEGVRRGLYASALIAPARLDLEADRYELEFCGIAVIAGRAQGPVAAAHCRGRISELLRRIARLGSDRVFFPLPDLIGAPTILVERVSFG